MSSNKWLKTTPALSRLRVLANRYVCGMYMRYKSNILALALLACSSASHAHGGISSGVGLVSFLYYSALAIIPAPFLLAAFLLRRNKKIIAIGMALLVAPAFLVGVFFLLCALAALFQGMAVVSFQLGFVGASLTYSSRQIFLSHKQYCEQINITKPSNGAQR